MKLMSDISNLLKDPYTIMQNAITQTFSFRDEDKSSYFHEYQTNILNNRRIPKDISIYRTQSSVISDYINFEKSDDEYINRENEERVELLARKYCNKNISNEETARLKILSNKIKKLIPLVSNSEYKILENVESDLKKIQSRNIKRKAKLKIK
jgi:hypothetical protein